jgi:hypothetical protein
LTGIHPTLTAIAVQSGASANSAKTKVKPKVFSGFDDDLSGDFND